MALYDEFTTPSKVNAQIDARLTGQKGEALGLAPLDEGILIPIEYIPIDSILVNPIFNDDLSEI